MTNAYTPASSPQSENAGALAAAFDRLGTRMTIARNAEIFAQDDRIEHLFRVVQGVVRTSRVTVEGRRQVGDFYYAGDIFGLDAGTHHRFAAEALSDVELQVVRRSAVRAYAGDAEVDRSILEATQVELERLQEHVVMLGRKTARERVGAFLMAAAQRGTDEQVSLPMSRQDIADYLGLTIETVCRILTQLRGEAVVDFRSTRRFQVRNWSELEALAA